MMYTNRIVWIISIVFALFLAIPTAMAEEDGADDGEAAEAAEETDTSATPERSAAQNGTIQLLEAKTAADVEEREAVNEGDSFSVGDSVTVWMAFRNPDHAQQVEVAWMAGDREIHTYNIDVGESWRWRTWASLSVGHAGDWSVEIRDGNGTTLETLAFTVEE